MPFKYRIFLLILVIAIVALAAVLLAPIAVSNGVRLWVWWFARQEGLVATIDRVDAPFLRPIVIRQIHLKSIRNDAVRVDATVLDARVGLNLKHVFLHLSGRDIRNISVREFHAEVHRTNPNVRALSERGWATLHRLLPETLSIAKLETRVEFDFAAERFAICKRDGTRPVHRGRADDYLTMGAPNFFAVARRNSLGSQSLDARRTDFDTRPRLAVRDGGSCAAGKPANGIAVRRRCVRRQTPSEYFARMALATF